MPELEIASAILSLLREAGMLGFLAFMLALERTERQRSREDHIRDLRRLAGYENKPSPDHETQSHDK